MIRLSPSSLSDFEKCPLIFWLGHHHGIKVPRGAFPSLPGGMDRIIKTYFDESRAAGRLPAELDGRLPAGFRLYHDQANIKRWRFWKTGLAVDFADGWTLSGALDDLLWNPDAEEVAVLDYKTRGAAPKEGGTEQYYGVQADCYALMLRENGFKVHLKAFFAYYFPRMKFQDTADHGVAFTFDTAVVSIEAVPERARGLCDRAFACLEGPMPELRPGDEISDFLVATVAKLGYSKTTATV